MRLKSIIKNALIPITRRRVYLWRLPDFPKTVQIEITNRCNAKCIMCPMRKMTREKGDMNMNLFEKLIDEIAQLDVNRVYLHIAGEPLLHPEIEKMVRYATNQKVKTCIATNMSLMSREKLLGLLSAGIDSFHISIDGANKEDYEKIRKLPWNTVMANLACFADVLAEKKPDLSELKIKILKFSETTGEDLNNFTKKCREQLGWVNNFHFHITSPEGYGGQIITDSIKELDKQQENYSVIKPKSFKVCEPLFGSLNVHYTGNVTGCCFDMNENLRLGDAVKDSLYDIWHGKDMTALRMAFIRQDFDSLPPMCKQCKAEKVAKK